MKIAKQTIDPSLTLAQLLQAVRFGEMSLGELRRILAEGDKTLVEFNSKARATAPISIVVDKGASGPPDGHRIVTRGSAFIEHIPTPVLAYRRDTSG